jgi:putative oxygen-independent coproporphyrinogen III oxidase
MEWIMSAPYGIYVHVPWCRTRCPYCAFNVFVDDEPPYERWRDGVLAGWTDVASAFSGNAHSLYFGGGTPSLAPPALLRTIIDQLPLAPGAEITLEANPGATDAATLQAFQQAGITRLSLGVQTWNRAQARRLGRGHTIEQTEQLLHDVAALGFNSWSIDLMFGLPGQTLAELETDLQRLVGLEPPHVSLYGLSIEPGTPFAQAQAAGQLSLPDEEHWRTQYDRIQAVLEGHGWERYEVSNYARPGHRAIHNEQIWRGGHYAGLGPGAHGFHPDGDRTLCATDWKDWDADPTPMRTRPTAEEAAVDYLLSSLRHIEGTQLEQLHARGHSIQPQTLHTLKDHRLITFSKTKVQLLPDAFPLADGIVRSLIGGLEAKTNP